jgi:hypothetical protein
VKQKILATTIGAALVIAPLPAFTADYSAPAQKTQNAGPLAPGKAAGVQQAQGNVDDTDLLWGAGLLGAVGLGAWALSQNNNNGGGGTTPTPTPTPTTTTTTP